jgi:N-acetylglucosaminyl-diphospho-decaprenol L-rhamnosyltransferase
MPDAIIIPVLNQWAYTESCLADLRKSVEADTKIIVVDNGSTDETRARLGGFGGVAVIRNTENKGFAGACNQGIEASAGCRWRIFLNNDVLLSRGWYCGLLGAAEQYGIDIISPSMREGPHNYDLEDRAAFLLQTLGNHLRKDMAHGVCFAVKAPVFDAVGGFDESFRIGQYEEADLYRRARQAGFRIATTGRSFIHHFSSVTQKALSKSSGPDYGSENQRYYRCKWKLNWFRRKMEKLQDGLKLKGYIRHEKRVADTLLVDRSD